MRKWFRIRLLDEGPGTHDAIVMKLRLDAEQPFRYVGEPEGLFTWRLEPDAAQILFLPEKAADPDPIRFATFLEPGSAITVEVKAFDPSQVQQVDGVITVRFRGIVTRDLSAIGVEFRLVTPLHPRDSNVGSTSPSATVIRGALTSKQWLEEVHHSNGVTRYLTLDGFTITEDGPRDPTAGPTPPPDDPSRTARRRLSDVFTSTLLSAPSRVLDTPDPRPLSRLARVPALLDRELVEGVAFVTDGADAAPFLTSTVRLSAARYEQCFVPHAWLRVAEWRVTTATEPATRQRALRMLRVAPFGLQPAWSASPLGEPTVIGERGQPRHIEVFGPRFDWQHPDDVSERWLVATWFGGVSRPPPEASLVEAWWSAQVVRPMHQALTKIRPELGVSMLPEVAEITGPAGEHRGFGVRLEVLRERTTPDGAYRLRLSDHLALLSAPALAIPTPESLALGVTRLTFTKFVDERGEALTAILRLTAKIESDDKHGHVIRLDFVGYRTSAPRVATVRVGAVRLDVPAVTAAEGVKTDQMRMAMRVNVGPRDGVWCARLQANAGNDVTADLPLESVSIVGVDPLPAELTATGLASVETIVVPPNDNTEKSAGLHLHAKETPAFDDPKDPKDHDLVLSVVVPDNTSPPVPFAFGLLQLGPVALLRVDGSFGRDGAEILRWSDGGGRVMRWSAPSSGQLTLTLPPQAVGEDMIDVKPPKDDVDPDSTDYNHGEAFRYRFSPPARIELRTSQRARGENVVPSNLGYLLGDSTSDAVGLPADSIDAELLYGLNFNIKHDRLNFAELDARLGRVPLHLETGLLRTVVSESYGGVSGDLGEKLKSRDADLEALQRALATRLAWFEVVDRGRPDDALVLEEGASSRLRPSRVIEYVPQTSPPKPCEEGAAVRGGADWPIKSPNIRRQMEGADATRTRLNDLALTMLGGFGRQRSEFQNGLSVIEADVRLGRVHRYTFQRLGRIGCLYHHARYVVVYERVVAKDGPFCGRSVLRKTEEYVEFLQRERRYPDDTTSPRVNGPIVGATFGSDRVNVDAKWGWDTADGWVLPLRAPNASSAVASDAPKLAFLCQSPPSQGSRELSAPVTDPASLGNLVFFTRTTSDANANVDLWPPAFGVDFDLAQPPTAASSPSPRLGGFDRFTWLIDAGSTPVDLTAARGVDPVAVVLRSVTVARRNLVSAPPLPDSAALLDAASKARELLDGIGNDVTALRNALMELQKPTTVIERLKKAQKERCERLLAQMLGDADRIGAEIRQAYSLFEAHERKDALDRLIAEALTKATVLGDLMRELDTVRAVVTERQKEAQQRIDDASQRLQKITDAATLRAEVARATILVVDAVHPAIVRAEAFASGQMLALRGVIVTWIDDAQQLLSQSGAVGTTLATRLKRFGSDLAAFVKTLETDLEGARKRLEAQLNSFTKKVNERITTLQAAAYDSADELLRAVRSELSVISESALDTLKDETAAFEGNLVQLVDGFASFQPKELTARISKLLPSDDSPAVREVRRVIETATSSWWVDPLGAVIEPLTARARQVIDVSKVNQLGQSGLSLLRAFGRSPVAETLNFARSEMEYVFREADIAVTKASAIVTAASALAHGDLPSFAMNVPIGAIADRFVPDIDADTLLCKLLPRIAGLDLKALLPDRVNGQALGRAVVLRHGVDPRTLQAWAEVRLDHRFASDVALLELPIVKIVLERPRLFASARVIASATGLRHESVARIEASWKLIMAGVEVLRLVDAALVVSPEGGIRFEVSPRQVRLPGILAFLQDLLSKVPTGNGSGFSLAITETDATARLAIALPALQTGAFSISGLAFATTFGIGYGSKFSLSAGVDLATRERPFNLSVLCLGGGGWFGAKVNWSVGGAPKAELGFGIAVGASLPFDIGVARGCVQILVDGALTWTGQGGVSFSLGATLRGELEILGVISVGVMVVLRVTYESGGSLLLDGRLEVKIKIFFFKISVSTGFSKRLGGGPPKRDDTSAPTVNDSVARHLRAYNI